MTKFVGALIFIFFMVIFNNMMFFYANLCFLLGFILIFNYSCNVGDLWVLLGGEFGADSYSFFMMVLSYWILGLMFISILPEGETYNSQAKVLMFMSVLLILILFFSSYNFMLLYLFFELSLVPTFFIVLYWGNNLERMEASFYLIMYMMLISLPLFFYVIQMYFINHTLDLNLSVVYNFFELGSWDFIIVMGAFLIKLPVYLFHVWLPKAHVEAPVYGSMLLAAILLKLGGYGLLRLMMIFVGSCLSNSLFVVSLGAVGALYVSIFCLVQVDMKSLVAYSSVVHMNFMLCSLFILVKLGTWGAYIMMITHGLCSSGLFYMVNMFYQRSFSRLLVMNKGYISLLSSSIMWWFLLCVSNFSFPLSLNFFGEVLMIMSVISWGVPMIFMVSLICFFSGAYSLYLFSLVSHGGVVMGFRISDSVSILDHLSLLMHYFPLLVLILNMLFI